ncbi:protein of unknown function [Pseudorhizobium banfieldiae]|uniref:Uncharacterized protein n=1 Tax=Pseudorhizobium banfieldiae TaxID=1125847 RepID=L0NG90_9HYPH|nr:protein of unknown function [Pseudorhizobium banfieldiae]
MVAVMITDHVRYMGQKNRYIPVEKRSLRVEWDLIDCIAVQLYADCNNPSWRHRCFLQLGLKQRPQLMLLVKNTEVRLHSTNCFSFRAASPAPETSQPTWVPPFK